MSVRGPSMADVARAAGVSGQTVSRVANGRSNVDAATRARVVAAMREVAYRPNGAARALRNGRFRSIGVIASTLGTLGNVATLDAVAAAAADAGYAVTLMPLDRSTQGAVSGAFDRLDVHAVDGVVILIETGDGGSAALELPAGVPVVVVDSGVRHDHVVVDTDQAGGATAAVEHLLDLGHETVWHIAGPDSSYSARRRSQAWADTLRRHGRRVPDVVVGDWSAATGHRLGAALAADPAVTAVFTANDQTALGLLRALHEAGRPAPHAVSVVGFDDMPEAADFWPPLTTVRQSFREVGRRAVHALIDDIEAGTAGSGSVVVPTELVVRASTCPPP